MGFFTKVQLIKRKKSEQWYVNFPSAIAQAMEFVKGEIVEWFVDDKETLVLRRPEAPPRRVKKKRRSASSTTSPSCGTKPAPDSSKSEHGNGFET